MFLTLKMIKAQQVKRSDCKTNFMLFFFDTFITVLRAVADLPVGDIGGHLRGKPKGRGAIE